MRKGGGNCLKYLERGWNRKEGKGHKDFKKEEEGREQARSRGGCLKKGGEAGTPLRTIFHLFPNSSMNKSSIWHCSQGCCTDHYHLIYTALAQSVGKL